MYEINTLLSNSYLKYKDSWEQARLIAYFIAQVNSKKKLKATDIVTFSWEEEATKHIKTISNQDIERLNRKAKQLENIYKK